MSEHEAPQPTPQPAERGAIHDSLERAEQTHFTRPIPKSAGARVRLILAKAKGSTKAAAERLGLSQRTIQRYLKGDIRTPSKATAAVLEQETTKDWQPQVRAQARAKASGAGGGMTITARATFGYRVAMKTTDQSRIRMIHEKVSSYWADQILAAKERGATETTLNELVAGAISEAYFRDHNTINPGLEVEFKDIDFIDISF